MVFHGYVKLLFFYSYVPLGQQPITSEPGRFRLLGQHLLKSQADVIALQEVFDGRIMSAIRRMAQDHYPYLAMGPGTKGWKLSSGLWILSYVPSHLLFSSSLSSFSSSRKHPIIHQSRIVFHRSTGFDSLARKGVLYARLALPNGTYVDVFNTHLDSGNNERVMWSQLSQMFRFMHHCVNGRWDRVLLLGDFNFRPTSKTYRRWSALIRHLLVSTTRP
jgi:endonuclease/exonuclease/phosphatase family metal-dependent hydrolase